MTTAPRVVPVEPTLYVASRTNRAELWRTYRDRDGVPIISSWIDEAGEGETNDFSELWQRIQREIAYSCGLLFYANTADAPWKGAFVEVGMALALGKPVGVVVAGELEGRTMRPVGSWILDKRVTRYQTLGHAFKAMLAASPAPSILEWVEGEIAYALKLISIAAPSFGVEALKERHSTLCEVRERVKKENAK